MLAHSALKVVLHDVFESCLKGDEQEEKAVLEGEGGGVSVEGREGTKSTKRVV